MKTVMDLEEIALQIRRLLSFASTEEERKAIKDTITDAMNEERWKQTDSAMGELRCYGVGGEILSRRNIPTRDSR